jgi:hypothetical protein
MTQSRPSHEHHNKNVFIIIIIILFVKKIRIKKNQVMKVKF